MQFTPGENLLSIRLNVQREGSAICRP